MNRRIRLSLSLMLLCTVILVGCKSNQNTPSTAAETETESTKETTPEQTKETESETVAAAEVEIQVFIAASLANAMDEIAEVYKEAAPNVKITYNADSSGTLQTQIEEGFSCDLFFSAATSNVTALTEGGYVIEGSAKDLLENKVVLIAGKGNQTKVTGFVNITEAASLALAGESVPAGKYARQIFESLGITDAVMAMEINECKNVTAVREAVKEGSNEVGIVYYSDAYAVKDDVDIIAEADASLLNDAIVYPAALINNPEADAATQAAAKAFLEFLFSDQAKTIFEKYMFIICE